MNSQTSIWAAIALGALATAAAAAPVNDNFAAPIELSGDNGTLSGNNNIDATFEVGEPVCIYAGTTNTVWFKWVCTQAGTFTLSTTGSTRSGGGEWDSVLCIYTGATLATLTQVAEKDSGYDETVDVAVSPGTYYIQAGGYWDPTADVATDIKLTWSLDVPAVVDISNDTTPWEIAWPAGGVNINSVVGTGNSGRLVGLTQTHWSSNNFSVPLDLNGNTLIVDSGGGNTMNAYGAISGSGDVTFDTVWGAKIGVAAINTYSGSTLLRRGSVHLENGDGEDALLGPITVGGSEMARIVWTNASNQINDAADVSLVVSGSQLDLAGYSDEINELRLITGTSVQTGVGGVLKVAKLFLDDVEQPEVAYIAGDGFVLGSGYIEVGASGPPIIVTPPAEPVNPSPLDLASDVHPAVLTKLDWDDSSGAASYDVYFWLDSESKPGSPTDNVGLSEYTLPAQVLSLSTYKWQVVAKNTAGDTPGAEWTFNTVDRTLVPGNTGVPYSDATHNLDFIVGIGNSGTLLGDFRVHWSGGPGSFSVPLDTNGFILDADTGGGNGGHVASGPISGTGSFVITHGPAGGAWDNIYTISGGTANTYSGGTLLRRGTILLNKTTGVDALPAGSTPITLGMAGDTARLVWGASDQINDAASITVLLPTISVPAPDANLNFLNLAGYSETIASLILPDDGTKTQVRTGDGGVLTVGTLEVNGSNLAADTYTSSNSTFVSGTGSVVVTGGSGSTYDTWAAGKGLTGDNALFGADPDGDGIINGIEAVIGGEPNPTHPDWNSSGLLPTGEVVGDDFVFTFTQMNDAAYLNPLVEFDADLQGVWTTAVDPDNATITVTPGSPADTITVAIPKGANTELFARLRATEP